MAKGLTDPLPPPHVRFFAIVISLKRVLRKGDTMERLRLVDPKHAQEEIHAELFDKVRKRMGIIPNITRAMANAPAVLEGYLEFSRALSKGNLSTRLRELIAIEVAQLNGCGYCLAAHSAIGAAAGLDVQSINRARKGEFDDTPTGEVLRFVKILVRNHGYVRDDDIARLRYAGFGDGEITEIIANVSINIFTNYFNHVAQTPIDFSQVPALSEV